VGVANAGAALSTIIIAINAARVNNIIMRFISATFFLLAPLGGELVM
jgi:hypothetical protein